MATLNDGGLLVLFRAVLAMTVVTFVFLSAMAGLLVGVFLGDALFQFFCFSSLPTAANRLQT